MSLQDRKRFRDLENEFIVTSREGIVREFRMVMYTLLCLIWIIKRTYCIAHETLLNVMWQPGWEESLEENGYMYMHG